jgi:hypothetical protein
VVGGFAAAPEMRIMSNQVTINASMHLLFPLFYGPAESALSQVGGVFFPMRIDLSIKGHFEKCDQHQNPVTDVRVLLDVSRKILLLAGAPIGSPLTL